MKKTRVLLLASSSKFAVSLACDLLYDPSLSIVAQVFNVRDAFRVLQEGDIRVILCDTRTAGVDPAVFSQVARERSVRVVYLIEAGSANAMQYHRADAEIATLPLQDTPQMNQNFARDLAGRIRQMVGWVDVGLLRYKWQPDNPFLTAFPGIIAIGASAGGTEATEAILRELPANMPGVVVVQHMPAAFVPIYAARLDRISRMAVREAKDGDEIRPGRVLIAPGGVQMRVAYSPGGHTPIVRCRGEERVGGHCPSANVLFGSIADTQNLVAIGIILSGMGEDGAHGLLSMRDRGCYTIGQDSRTSAVYGMPHVAYKIGAVAQQLPIEEIARALCSHLMA